MARNTLPALKGLLAKYTAQEAIPKGERRVIDDQIVIGTGNPYYAWRRPDKKGMILLNPQEGNIGNQSSGEAVPGGETAGKNNDPFELTEEQSYHLGRLLRGWADTPGGFDEVRDVGNRTSNCKGFTKLSHRFYPMDSSTTTGLVSMICSYMTVDVIYGSNAILKTNRKVQAAPLWMKSKGPTSG